MLTGAERIEVGSSKWTALRPHEVRIRVEAAGICGSDLHLWRGTDPWGRCFAPPYAVGHEIAGEVVEAGRDVLSMTGTRVAVQPRHLRWCGTCDACARGATHLCRTRGVGAERSYGFADFITADAAMCVGLPSGVSAAPGALTDVFACALHALERSDLRRGETLAVVGTGAQGIACALMARRLYQASVVIVGRRSSSTTTAAALTNAEPVISSSGALGSIDAAVAIDAAGGAPALRSAVAVSRPGASLVILGAHETPVQFSYAEANRKELTVRWSSSYTGGPRGDFERAAAYVISHVEEAASLITHRFSLADISQAFEVAADRDGHGAVKVIVEPSRTCAA